MEKTKIRVKYDMWFLIVLTILLWTLVNQLYSFMILLPGNWDNTSLWLRIAANSIAIFGNVWVFRMYIANTRRKAKQNNKIAQAIKEHPELEGIIQDIMER